MNFKALAELRTASVFFAVFACIMPVWIKRTICMYLNEKELGSFLNNLS